MPIRESVSQREVDADTGSPPAVAVRRAAYRVAAFHHDGSDASDVYWDALCDEVAAAVEAWKKACGRGEGT